MSELPLVLISHKLPVEWLTPLAGKCRVVMGPSTKVERGLSAEIQAQLPQADALLTMLTVRVDGPLLDQAPQLKVVSQMAVGVDNIDLDACTARGIPVGHTPGVLTDATANIALALLLATARRLPETSADAKAGKWGEWEPTQWLGSDLAGATLGIIGMGKIGKATARRAMAFGMKIIYTSRNYYPEIEDEFGAEYHAIDELLATCDFISLHTPLTPLTHHLIGERELGLMKPSAILINTARGGVVDTVALTKALKTGSIRAAGLDVTDPEPLPNNHPLYQLPNCLITPHIGSATEKTRRAMAERACHNLLAVLGGNSPPFCANPTILDR